MFDITAPHFTDKDAAREYLEGLRWPNGPVCPHCGTEGEHYKLEGKSHRPGLWKCSEYECRKQFSVTVGTVFERSKVPLNKWLLATHFMCASKKGMSAHQIHRMIGVTYKTAWFMCHRIREAMTQPGGGLLGNGGEPVEVDETFWGTSKDKKSPKARGYDHKMKVVSLVERNGEKRSYHVANVNIKTVRPILEAQVSKKARLMTDEAGIYTKVGREYAEHGVVVHAKKEYSRGDITTNNVESSFALLKRGLYGTFHKVSEAHLQRYANEFDFRWNHRKTTDAQRAAAALVGIQGKRLTYRRTDSPRIGA